MTDQILAFVERYGLITLRLAMRLTGKRQKATERYLTLLLNRNKLVSRPLYRRVRYYTTADKVFRGRQSLIKAYALAWFDHEIIPAEKFGDVPVAIVKQPHYFDGDVISLVVVDCGGNSIRRFKKKCRRCYEQRKALPLFSQFIAAKLFSITVITAFDSKARRVEKALVGFECPTKVVVVPQYGPLLLEE